MVSGVLHYGQRLASQAESRAGLCMADPRAGDPAAVAQIFKGIDETKQRGYHSVATEAPVLAALKVRAMRRSVDFPGSARDTHYCWWNVGTAIQSFVVD